MFKFKERGFIVKSCFNGITKENKINAISIQDAFNKISQQFKLKEGDTLNLSVM